MSDIHKICRAVSDPVFIQHQFLVDGHSSRHKNATVTFIKYRNRPFAVTCRHVVGQVKESEVLALMVDRLVLNFTSFNLDKKYVTSFALPEDASVDISICQLPPGPWHMLAEKKTKSVIDLDNFTPPDWSQVNLCFAAGYPSEHKTEKGGMVQAPMGVAVAQLQSVVSKGATAFSLHSTLQAPHEWYFSGMSGGPIFTEISTETFLPIGIIFEGMPSSKDSPPSIFVASPNDIFIRGLILTPTTFQAWLDQLMLPH